MPILQDIISGDTLEIEISLPDYSSATYDIWIALRGIDVIDLKTGQSGVTVTPESDGSFTVSVTATQTGTWTAGEYWYGIYAGKTAWAERYKIYDGIVTIKPDLAAVASTYDGRTHAKICLDAIEAVLESRATLDQMSYQIAGRRLDKTPVSDLLQLRNYYRVEVLQEKKKENILNGEDAGNFVKVQF